MQSIKTTSIAKGIAQIEDILLRETQAIKLIFRPLILDNVGNPEASLKGVFIYQKKGKNDDWTDIENIPFTSLKKGEGYKLELHSEEVLKLLGSFVQIKELYNHFGIKYGENEFFITEKNIDSIFDKLSSIDNKEMILEGLNKLDFDKLENIESLVNINRLTRIVSDIKNNLDNDDEKGFWQPLFKNQSWIISQIFSSPFLFVDDEFFVGGKRGNNNGGVSTDYLYENSLTKNVAFIEVKTPNAKLVEGSLYRGKNDGDNNAIYSPSKELTGPVNQVLNQKNLFIQKKDSLEEGDKKTFNSKCILIVGNMSTLSEGQQKSFELYRNSLREVEIITFDELLLKIENILKIFSGGNHQEKEKLIDDIPF